MDRSVHMILIWMAHHLRLRFMLFRHRRRRLSMHRLRRHYLMLRVVALIFLDARKNHYMRGVRLPQILRHWIQARHIELLRLSDTKPRPLNCLASPR